MRLMDLMMLLLRRQRNLFVDIELWFVVGDVMMSGLDR
jgi:hypothetical protein